MSKVDHKRMKPARPSLSAAFAGVLEKMESRVMFSAFTNGDLAVVRIGAPGSGATIAGSDVGTAVFIDEYTPTGTLVQTIPLPTSSTAGSNQALVLGNNNSEGELNLSTDGKDLLLAGYDSTVGGAVDAATSASTPRTIGEISGAGTVNTKTALTDLASGANVRGATGSDATGFWAAGQDKGTALSGVRYVPSLGSSVTTSTPLTSSTIANARNVEIWNGQLYVTQNKAAGTIIEALDGSTGSLQTPTTGTPTVNALPNIGATPYLAANTSTNTNAKTGSFFFAKIGSAADFQINGADSGYNTLYVADSDAAHSTGSAPGITKYSYVSNAWVSNGTLGSSSLSYEGLTGSVSGSTVTLYATIVNPTGTGSGIVSISDASGFNSLLTTATQTTIVAAPTGGTAYRGIAFAPYAAPMPAVTAVTVSPNSVLPGNNVTLTATVTETGGTASSVSFYREAANGTENTAVDTLVPGTATNNSGTWTLSNVSTSSLAPGNYTFYAVATDATNGTNSGFGSAPTATLTITSIAPAITQ